MLTIISRFMAKYPALLPLSVTFLIITQSALSNVHNDGIGESGSHDRARETGLVGEKYANLFEKYNQISAGGDLNVNIPLMTVPGRIPIELSLNYQSGIKIDQPATWVGLGWSLANWSVRRITVHGDDPNSFNQNAPNTRDNINDMYTVTIPGRSLKFINVGTVASPVYIPQTYSNDSLFSENHISHAWWDYWDHNYFILTDKEGTRYIFAQPLKRTTQQGPGAFWRPYNNEWTTPIDSANGEWLLTAILSYDYVDGGGDTLNPLDCADPRTNNKGYWIAFVYSSYGSRFLSNTEYSKGAFFLGPLMADDSNHDAGLNSDRTEFAYLRKIITPSSVAQFDLDSLHYFWTPRYYRSHYLVDHRIKDGVLWSIKLFEYSGDSTLPTGPALFSVCFDYENGSASYHGEDSLPLKCDYYSPMHFGDVHNRMGEPKLRRVVFGEEIANNAQLAGEHVLSGYKKEYSFEYYIDSPIIFDSVDYGLSYNTCYRYWARGGPTEYEVDTTDVNIEGYMKGYYFGSVWGGRDYFGYYFAYPEVWSLKQLTIPEGLHFQYDYEPDKFKIDTNSWSSGGTRVKSIIINAHIPCTIGISESADDYSKNDTMKYTYGNSDDGQGFASAMPPAYHKIRTRYLDTAYREFCGHPYSKNVERFEGEDVDCEIQYPKITRHLPRSGGIVENYFTTADSVGTHREYGVKYCVNISAYCDYVEHLVDNINIYHSVWQDRTPFLGLLYKSVMKDDTGATLSSEQYYYSWIPIKADTFINDGMTSCGDATSCTAFPVGDTIAASYFVRLDSAVKTRDGVMKVSTYDYDSFHRLTETKEYNNDNIRITTYKYASSYYPFMRTHHYLSQYKSIIEEVAIYNLNHTLLRKYTDIEYISDMAGQNLAGQNRIWYPSKTKEWIDLNSNDRIDSASGDGYEFLVTENIRIDKYGNVTWVLNPDGTKNAYIYSYRNQEGSFENVSDSNCAIMTAEADRNNQVAIWGLGSNGVLDSMTAFTGRKSVRIITVPDDSDIKWGPVAILNHPDSDLYIAELWGKCTVANKYRLTMQAAANGQYRHTLHFINISDQWQKVACSLSVYSGETLKVYTAFEGTGSDAETTYVDDIRVYPIGALVKSRTYDGMLRVATESDYDNIPVRNYYDQYNGLAIKADNKNNPINGQEWFYKTTEIWGRGDPYRYNRSLPNIQINFQPRGNGLVEDFSSDPFLKYNIDSNGTFYWDAAAQRLRLDVSLTDVTFGEIVIPVDSFSDGFLAVNVLTTAGTAGGEGVSSLPHAPVWIGFENNGDSGYVLGFDSFGSAILGSYSGPDYAGIDTIGKAISTENQMFLLPGSIARLMFGKMGDMIYIFCNNDCKYIFRDSTLKSFNKLRLRVRSIIPQAGSRYFWLDNIVFYNNPAVEVDFVNAFGITKQTQIYDGKNLICSAKRNNNDFKDQVLFKPISLTPNIHYWEYNVPQTYSDHRSLFDYIYKYVDDSIMYNTSRYPHWGYIWQPGEELINSDYIYTYFYDTAGVPDCYDSIAGIITPYIENVYYNDPLKRLREVRYEGKFRHHVLAYEYGTSDNEIIGFEPGYFGAGKVYKEKMIDENGNINVLFKDKDANLIELISDSSEDGLKATTLFYPDINGLDTLIVQPNGNKIKKHYNNLGWLLTDSGGDYGRVRYMYDKAGNLRFTKTATDSVNSGFHYKKYDKLNRVVEEGICRFPAMFIWVIANVPEMPNMFATVTATYEYDKGHFGRGLLTKATRYPSGVPDSASWDTYEYDEYGRVVRHEQFVNLINTCPRVMQASYNLQGQETRLIYPDGKYVDYTYNSAGQVGEVIASDSSLRVALDYWPGGLLRKKVLGFEDGGRTPAQVVDYKYNARDWLVSINSTAVNTTTGTGDHYALKLTYESGAYRGNQDSISGEYQYPAAYYNGNIASYKIETSPRNTASLLLQKFAYDKLDRLAAAEYSLIPLAFPKIRYKYDLNGNIDSVVTDSTQYGYTYYPGTNRVKRVAGLLSGDITYTPSGSMTTYDSLTGISYNLDEEMSRRNRTFSLGPFWVQYWYNTSGNRIAKRYDYDYEYWCGIDSVPEPNFVSSGLTGLGEDSGSTSISIDGSSELMAEDNIEVESDDLESIGGEGEMSVNSSSSSSSSPGEWCQTHGYDLEGYYYFGDRLMSVYSGPGETSLADNYVYLNGERVARFKSDTNDVRYYLNDHLGSVIGTVKRNGTLTSATQYSPYGKIYRRTLNDPSFRHAYTGHELDHELDESWYYYGARYYIPDLCLFSQVDPMKDKYLSLSPFLYCADNPMKYVDPKGSDFDIWSWIFQKEDKQKKQEAERGAEMPQAMDTPKMMETVATVNNALEQTAVNMQNAAVNAAQKVETPLTIAGGAAIVAGTIVESPIVIGTGTVMAVGGVVANGITAFDNPTKNNINNLSLQLSLMLISKGLSGAYQAEMQAGTKLLTPAGARVYNAGLQGGTVGVSLIGAKIIQSNLSPMKPNGNPPAYPKNIPQP